VVREGAVEGYVVTRRIEMSEKKVRVCDGTGQTRLVGRYRIGIEQGDHEGNFQGVYAKLCDFSPKGLKRLIGFIERGSRLPKQEPCPIEEVTSGE
jgi:hypothetical protein